MLGIGYVLRRKETATMGRKKGVRPKRSLSTSGATPNALVIRGRATWLAWLKRVASARRIKPTEAIDQALLDWAARHGLEPPPERL
jgi:hypothetical protein